MNDARKRRNPRQGALLYLALGAAILLAWFFAAELG
jgi:hypothetical protein